MCNMYVDIDGRMSSRNRSYELAPMTISPYITREEFADAKKELAELRIKKDELLKKIGQEKKERDERISAYELQEIMLPVENVDRQIEELSNLLNNAQIVEKSSRVPQEELQEALIDEGILTAEQLENPEGDTETDTAERIPEAMFFVKDGVKVDAKPGNRTPFFAFVDGEYMGFNRLILNGWMLADDVNRYIEDITEAWRISKEMSGKERANIIQSARDRYPNAFSPWTAEENEKVIDLYRNQEKTIAEISEILGRTKNGISLQIKNLLGLERLPYRQKQKDLDEYSQSPISITSINPSEIPDERMPEYLDLIAQMEEWFKYVKDYANQQAVENGVYYEGYEVQTTVKNSFSDTKKVMDTIREEFPDLFSSCVQLKSISSIKKTLGEENYNASIAEFVGQKEQKSLVKSNQ